MKDEKEMEMMGGHCHGGFGGKHTYMLIGTVVFVYGLMNYFMVAQGWPAYAAWMVGGILLILVGWAKMWMWKMRMEKGM